MIDWGFMYVGVIVCVVCVMARWPAVGLNIWLMRNGILFENIVCDMQKLFVSILSQAAFWIKVNSRLCFDIKDFIFHIEEIRKG